MAIGDKKMKAYTEKEIEQLNIGRLKELRHYLNLAEYACKIDHQDKYRHLLDFAYVWFNFPKHIYMTARLKKRIDAILYGTVKTGNKAKYTRLYFNELAKK